MPDDTRARLRALPSFPPGLPAFDIEHVPAEPVELFLDWLRAAVDAGVLAAHAAVLSTSDADGRVSARTLVLKDVDPDGWMIATPSTGAAGVAMRANPNAALTFFWPQLGRQVKVTGRVAEASREDSAADFRARPAAEAHAVPDDWRLWAIVAESVEFWQASHDRAHLRLEYRRDGGGWRRRRLRP